MSVSCTHGRGSPACRVADLAARGPWLRRPCGHWVPAAQPCVSSEPAGPEHQAGPAGAPWVLERLDGRRTPDVWNDTFLPLFAGISNDCGEASARGEVGSTLPGSLWAEHPAQTSASRRERGKQCRSENRRACVQGWECAAAPAGSPASGRDGSRVHGSTGLCSRPLVSERFPHTGLLFRCGFLMERGRGKGP